MRKYVCPRPFHSFHSIKSHIKGILDIEGGSNRFSASDCMKYEIGHVTVLVYYARIDGQFYKY